MMAAALATGPTAPAVVIYLSKGFEPLVCGDFRSTSSSIEKLSVEACELLQSNGKLHFRCAVTITLAVCLLASTTPKFARA
jgi:hypothetical protein